MSNFLTSLFESIFTPGPTHTLLVATNVSFACLQVTLLALLIATYSIHFAVLSFLSAGLWWSINWFVSELRTAQAAEDEKKRQAELATGEDTDTEVETVLDSAPKSGSTQVEAEEKKGELTGRKPISASRSETSTEDEWERVSENEKDK